MSTHFGYAPPSGKIKKKLTINCYGVNRFAYEPAAGKIDGMIINADVTLLGSGSLNMTQGSDSDHGGIYIEAGKNLYNYTTLKTTRVYGSGANSSKVGWMSCRDDYASPGKTGRLMATGHPDGTFKNVLMWTPRRSYSSSAGSWSMSQDAYLRLPFKTYAKKSVVYQYNDGDVCGVVDIFHHHVTGLVEYEGEQTVYP